ncbi:Tsi3 family protein [Pseudaestuariivita rosea]|uniref:Tsi3 family protein n=1 Tax=Pseudaestuariivita rosea TaxID=2763263 RepID=UPI001ABB5B8C|nr:Tsi3 family protein [Pseudaestuariivita rosea]
MRVVFFILLTVFLAACKEDELTNQIVVHQNGLIVPVPEGFNIEKQPNGFRFVEAGQLRTPRQVTVSYVASQPVGVFDHHRHLRYATAFYSVDHHLGGSAGRIFDFRAMKPDRKGWVVIAATDQTEWVRPDFDLAWQMLDRAQGRYNAQGR